MNFLHALSTTDQLIELIPPFGNILVAYLIKPRLMLAQTYQGKEQKISKSIKYLTSKLLFLAVESCNDLTQISATSAQLIPCNNFKL